jgi:hypothetical protein
LRIGDQLLPVISPGCWENARLQFDTGFTAHPRLLQRVATTEHASGSTKPNRHSLEASPEQHGDARAIVWRDPAIPITALCSRAQPGWRWSECIKPIVGGESCQSHHVGVLISGAMHVVHNDGTESDIATGSGYVIEPGHDAWVVGDAPAVAYEFDSSTAATFAKGS